MCVCAWLLELTIRKKKGKNKKKNILVKYYVKKEHNIKYSFAITQDT